MIIKCKHCELQFESEYTFNMHACNTPYMIALREVLAEKVAGTFYYATFQSCQEEAQRRVNIGLVI